MVVNVGQATATILLDMVDGRAGSCGSRFEP